MPLESKAQGRFLNAKFGHDWVRAHHFDGKQTGLPEYVARGTPNVGLHIFQRHIAIFHPKATGDHPAIQYPPGHLVGVRVPHGGSCCAKCKFVSADKKSCGNDLFQYWNFDDPRLPKAADIYCCDFFSPAPGTLSK